MIELLECLLAEVRGLRADRAETSACTPSAGGRAQLAIILPVWASSIGSRSIRASEALRDVNVALVAGAMTAATLGSLLRNAQGTPIGKYVVENVSTESGRRLWRVVEVT